MSFDKIKYNNNYTSEHYTRISANIPKGKEIEIKEYYKSKGFRSMSEYLIYLINKDMNTDIKSIG